MSCFIKIPFTADPTTVINRAKAAMQKAGGTFNGDNNRGSFSVSIPIGTIAAEYIISGQELQVTVTKKPLIVSCNRIEQFLKDNMNM